MFSIKFNCKRDPLLTQLHTTYNATPFLPPMNSIRPLDLVAHRGEKTMHLGTLAQVLLPVDTPFGMEEQNATVSNVSLKKTSNFSVELGLKLLDGICGGFKISIDPLKAALKNAKEISLDFEGTRRRSVFHTDLGSALRNRTMDLGHPTIKGLFSANKPLGMFVISSVLESRQFSIQFGETDNFGLEVEVPVLEKLTDVGFKVQRDGQKVVNISHEGEEYLVFAFSCFQLQKDSQGGLSVQEEVTWIRGFGDQDGEDATEPETPEISLMNPQLPAILAWD